MMIWSIRTFLPLDTARPQGPASSRRPCRRRGPRGGRSTAPRARSRSPATSRCIDGRPEEDRPVRDDRPLVALTMGDVAGVGPEVIARAWAGEALRGLARPFVVGDSATLRRAVALLDTGASVR